MTTISIRQVAEKCGVAVSTVSRAMNNRSEVSPETRERILVAARELGYVPNANARGLKISDLQTVSVVIQGRTSELLIEILGYLQDRLASLGLDVFLQHIPDEDVSLEALNNLVLERRPAGLVFLGRFGANSETSGEEINRAIEDFSIPIVFCTATPSAGRRSRHSAVSVNDSGGAKQLTELLIGRGHKRIAFCTADPGDAMEGSDIWAARYRGYRSALEDAKIDLDPSLVIPSTDPVDAYSATTAYNSVRNWLATNPDFTAIVTSCDAVGLGTLRALREFGLEVPTNVEVTAFDGLELSQYCNPTLTTLVQPLEQLATVCADVVFDAVNNPEHQPTWHLIDGNVRVGESTSATQLHRKPKRDVRD